MTVEPKSGSPGPPSSHEVAWIAGVGAAAGLGAALGRRFARAGLHVALTGRTPQRLQALAAQIIASGGSASALPGDLSSERDLARLALEVERLGVLRCAVFNAGNAVRATPLEVTPEQFEAVWRGGTYAGFVFALTAVPRLLAGGGGSLLFTGATASVRGGAQFVAFASAKAALRSVAQSFARAYGPRGIHVGHIVIDGGIDGERLRRSAPERVAQAGADGLLDPEAIAESYWQLHAQQRSAWTHELDVRPYKESF